MAKHAIKKTKSFTQVFKEATQQQQRTPLEARAVCGPQQENDKSMHETRKRKPAPKLKYNNNMFLLLTVQQKTARNCLGVMVP